MNRRTLPALTALATATALLLTGCGGESSDPDDKIAGAGENSAEASASPGEKGAGDGIDRPEMEFPGDMEVVLDWGQPSEADQAAALHDAGEYMTAVNYGVEKQDPENAAYKFYVVPLSSAHTFAKDMIKKHVDAGLTGTGALRFSNGKVKLSESGNTASVTFCRDESKYFNKEVKSGKVHKTKVDEKSYYAFTLIMERAKVPKGLWRAKDIAGERGASECVGV
ncbi:MULTISPECIES: hypothetical protein [Streptomyces]|uniref:Lipoprotein n=4 Tax=Streptomyces TaxID=1883 RepID=A0A8H9HN99_9ACTN|nr:MULTISPECIES: hypothetical protein [Streptomyces]NEE47215.1 hypothetical protein [Streptomyces sp. SID8455]MBL3805183.1 hypothetical protein [Streptomyces sp. BRB081]MDQ0293984.1 hypothetical protein [Streptomyces sp. DSM 41037]QNE82557.1 hypothetical protein F0345_16745 [Streptomyces rutgersensis]SUO93640.1 Lipoprotein [Streptomyces griseus]